MLLICLCRDFESEGLCKGDHRGARTLLIVTPDARKTGQTYPEFKRKFNEKIWAYKVYAREHFLNPIFSVHISTYSLNNF